MSDQNSTANQLDFSSVLAAAAHDMKNSLCLLLQAIEDLSHQLPDDNDKARNQVASVHYEASRLNTNLVQMLSLYRSELDALPITVDECFISDLFEDVIGANRLYTEQKSIQVDIEVDNDLTWYLDSELVFLLVNDVVINALRYGTSRIRLSAHSENQQLVMRVEDDGPGYPQEMLDKSLAQLSEFQVSQGRTGLGLYFARLIVEAHCRGQHTGKISLSNGGMLGGSVFEVKLP
ncbi:sensor histidine kinase [Alteromonas aestuariivivens]|uniref:histidine kinase n=1 Tax=Alteromonas aestuariivivens TaxID=1938339 RepID=A0A3D8M9L2_9ALTE|nr:HAMP domain-containing sensor histidine kinase [Alteromonas aestuariivivens]RDV26000.1 sensor histidine kinase [Alteromonas aestuariivivens]